MSAHDPQLDPLQTARGTVARLLTRRTGRAAITDAALIEQILSAIIGAIDADFGLLYLVDASGALHLSASAGVPDPAPQPIARLIAGDALFREMSASRAPVSLDLHGLAATPRADAARALGVRAWTGAPLLHDGQLYGSVAFASTRAPAFTEDATALVAWTAAALVGLVREPPPRGDGLHVLVVDDDPLVLQSLRARLERLGFRVTACTSAEAALALLDRFTGDALVTDQHMPGMTGTELGARVRALRPALPMILMSGNLDSTTEVEARALGFAHVIRKPGVEGIARCVVEITRS